MVVFLYLDAGFKGGPFTENLDTNGIFVQGVGNSKVNNKTLSNFKTGLDNFKLGEDITTIGEETINAIKSFLNDDLNIKGSSGKSDKIVLELYDYDHSLDDGLTTTTRDTLVDPTDKARQGVDEINANNLKEIFEQYEKEYDAIYNKSL